MRHSERIALLMFRFIRDELTDEENRELNEWRSLSPENEYFFKEETDPSNIRNEIREIYENKDAIFKRIQEKYPEISEKRRSGRNFFRISIAATFILAIGISAYFISNNILKKKKSSNRNEIGIKSIQPGGNHASLILSNGSAILLDSIDNGPFRVTALKNINKINSNTLSYSEDSDKKDKSPGLNALITPRGGQFNLELSDGTKIWLNASSSLKYPIFFTQGERNVELEGEAYFEVTKNPKSPFHVKVNGIDVEVLGTHFNIMAYANEPVIAATLLEGKVKISEYRDHYLNQRNKEKGAHGLSRMQQGVILKPGQQARINQLNYDSKDENSNGDTSFNNRIKVLNEVDVNAVVDWKNGRTSFKNASIQEIMRSVSRWYDVDIVYKGVIPDKSFKGGLPRNTDLSELLNVLRQSGIHFTIEGKKIIVTP